MPVHYSSNTKLTAKLVEQGAMRLVAKTAFNILAYSRSNHAYTVQTGTLKNSGFVDVQDDRAVIGYSADYAYFVEGGTRKMAPKPFLLPAFERHKPIFMAELKAMVNAV